MYGRLAVGFVIAGAVAGMALYVFRRELAPLETWLGENSGGAGLGVGLASLAVAIGGFTLTLSQLSRTQEAASAAQEATQRVTRLLRQNQILQLVQPMQTSARNISRAVKGKNSDEAFEELSVWRVQSAEMQGLLDSSNEEQQALLDALVLSATFAKVAADALLDAGVDVAEVTKDARQKIDVAAERITTFAARMRSAPPEGTG